ncbi:hypothetical protein HDU96_000215 [Phlyctochytrium bullatum]|nr:hypothetical protein HDU96_000215 [Phlyctochytrium bullatum]
MKVKLLSATIEALDVLARTAADTHKTWSYENAINDNRDMARNMFDAFGRRKDNALLGTRDKVKLRIEVLGASILQIGKKLNSKPRYNTLSDEQLREDVVFTEPLRLPEVDDIEDDDIDEDEDELSIDKPSESSTSAPMDASVAITPLPSASAAITPVPSASAPIAPLPSALAVNTPLTWDQVKAELELQRPDTRDPRFRYFRALECIAIIMQDVRNAAIFFEEELTYWYTLAMHINSSTCFENKKAASDYCRMKMEYLQALRTSWIEAKIPLNLSELIPDKDLPFENLPTENDRRLFLAQLEPAFFEHLLQVAGKLGNLSVNQCYHTKQ